MKIREIGVIRCIGQWKRFLKPNGFLAVSELTWITPGRPDAIEKYWKDQYCEIDTIENKVRALEENGYRPVAQHILPEDCWSLLRPHGTQGSRVPQKI